MYSNKFEVTETLTKVHIFDHNIFFTSLAVLEKSLMAYIKKNCAFVASKVPTTQTLSSGSQSV